ncbi:MAG: tRNA preQ1(34) S-adenosylmethionine ribosyltransferase-isomerase QueA [Myxococcales bacterium FL481]|nr:MAG: tRNA preQ1(34) S-adenosylmethionine ribosyltransferase-isomerase QueA [Myxococcales bacterium FL481]
MLSPDDFSYELDEGLIAQTPAERRSAARMLVVGPGAPGELEHRLVVDLPRLLPPRALVVLNDTRVLPSRLYLRRVLDDREFELLLCEPGSPASSFGAWVRGAKRLEPGDELAAHDVAVRYRDRDPTDSRVCWFERLRGDLDDLVRTHGHLPLPPYIARPQGATGDDLERYQTVFAQHDGSVAAPTAGLHFDDEMLRRIDSVSLTLHVGPGTFLPMEVADVREHRVGAERFAVSPGAAERIEQARRAGRPIVAVGTTVTRTLEHVAAQHDGHVVPGSGITDLVIGPGHRWRVVDALLTNLHLPKSSLLMLTCAFGGRRRVLSAYAEAVRAQYRFYSYGDCMLIPTRRGSEGADDD